jgi:TatD DNase family protein
MHPTSRPTGFTALRPDRDAGLPQGRNEPAELPRIAAVLAELRGLEAGELARATSANALAALPRLQALINA